MNAKVEIDMSAFANNLRWLMYRNKLGIRELAKILGTSPATMTRYAQGERVPDTNYLLAIVNHFDVSVDWLLGLEPRDRDTAEDIAQKYKMATDEEKLLIQTILRKYRLKEAESDEPIDNQE